MPHADNLILTLVGGFVLAFVFGMLANRLKLSPLVGYLVAGVVVGPHTAGFVADTELAPQLAEIGVILLMFGVGLQFHIEELLAVRGVAVPGAIGNVIDRIRFGFVVDFLDFSGTGFFPWVFNVADSAITIGVVLLILDSVLSERAAKVGVAAEKS